MNKKFLIIKGLKIIRSASIKPHEKFEQISILKCNGKKTLIFKFGLYETRPDGYYE